MNTIPKRLGKDPLIEALWQMQFDSPNAGDALPGLLYAKLRQQYPSLQLHRLPTAEIPAAVAQFDPNLRLAAKVRLEATDAPFLWQVGDRVVTLNCRKPYVGWRHFKTAILDLIQTIEGSGLLPRPSRHSLRYINLLTLDSPPDISVLQLTLQIGARAIVKLPLQMRVELPDAAYVHVIQIATPARVRLPEGIHEGNVVDIETQNVDAPGSWDEVRYQLEGLHERSKQLFFAQLLTPQAIQALDPEY